MTRPSLMLTPLAAMLSLDRTTQRSECRWQTCHDIRDVQRRNTAYNGGKTVVQSVCSLGLKLSQKCWLTLRLADCSTEACAVRLYIACMQGNCNIANDALAGLKCSCSPCYCVTWVSSCVLSKCENMADVCTRHGCVTTLCCCAHHNMWHLC